MFIRSQIGTLRRRDQQVFEGAGAPGCSWQALGTLGERGTRNGAVAGEKTAELMQRRLSATIPKDMLQSKPWEQVLHSWSENRLRS